MSSIWITDNHEPISLDAESNDRYNRDFATDAELEDVKDAIGIIANKTIETQRKNNPNLLVFPPDLKQHGDEIGDDQILSFSDGKISTGNIMGFVGVNQTQIDIRSRFAQTDGNDYFLHYMLQKVFAINLFDLKHDTSAERIFDFLFYLFPHFLRKAVAQGVFKKYRRFEHNDANIRGPIDVSRHIRQNIPFRGTVAYTTREHTYDNELTQLVRHTIEFIRGKEQGQSILNNDADTKTAVSQIVMATPTYNARERAKIVSQNLRPVRHPYFSAYTDLQRLCLQILRHEELKYGRQKDQIYGILFDGAWLWEEYLNTIFEKKKLGITHAKNKTGENGIQIYKGSHKYFPDFYIQTKGDETGEKSFVFDAKYKRLVRGEIDETQNNISICRDDLFQMITYMHVLPAKHCALLYPIELDETQEEKAVLSIPRQLCGLGGNIYGIGIRVEQTASDYDKYKAAMEDVENALKTQIKTLLKTE
ncbi:MAG: hypothetical protein J6Y82_06690 [Bacteroidales bacterium]|nr:hypothetical protein [Bacteroidales bacterium]